MNTFQQHLSGWLARSESKQVELAEAIGKQQASISRYAKGERFPDAETARAIEAATGGFVPFSAWQADFMRRSGLAA